MKEPFDLVVVGAGSAGLSAATFAARLGARVALVERDRVGGDCTWSGCVPSKALLKAAKVAREMRRADVFGIGPVEPEIDLGKVMARVRATIERVYRFESPQALAEQGVKVVLGAARFLDPWHVQVDGRTLQARRFAICTGARASIPPIPGLDETPYVTYEQVFELETLPRRLLVLGGGPSGVEFAQAFQGLGSRVTLLEQEERVLPMADVEGSAVLAGQLEAEGVQVRTRVVVERVETWDGEMAVLVGGEACVGDALLVAVGRRPNVEGLGLEQAGVAYSSQGIRVDERLRTSQPHIYACGDVTGALQLTPYAAWQGFLAARNALMPGHSTGVRRWVPWVVFTDPEIAQVGLDECQARQRWRNVLIVRWPIERVDRAQTEAEPAGLIKLIARQDGTLVGAMVVAGVAGELINELSLALERRLSLRDLAATMHAYPTYSFGLQHASAEATMQRLTEGRWRRLLKLMAHV